MIASTPSGGASHAQSVDRYATVNGLRLHYLDWGTRGEQPLILLHGIARAAHSFDHLAPHYSGNYHVIAVDMRGHGDSDWDPEGAYLVEGYAGDIKVLAGSHPELVAAVISEDVGPERPAAISSRRANRMALEENGWTSQDELLAQTKADYPLTSEPVLRNLVRHGSKQRGDSRVVWKRDPAILKGFVPTELWASVGRIKAPIIYILGGASTIVPRETQERLRQTLPQVQIVAMPGLGHYPSDERPGDFIAIADGFLAAAKKIPGGAGDFVAGEMNR